MTNAAPLKTNVSVLTTALIVVPTIITVTFGVGMLGALLGSEYDSSCTVTGKSEPVCTTRYQYHKLADLDIPMPSLQVVAAAIGMGCGIFAGLKNGKIPNSVKKMFSDEKESDGNDTTDTTTNPDVPSSS